MFDSPNAHVTPALAALSSIDMRPKVALLALGLGLLGALAFAVPAVAGQSPPGTLNPPPPAFEICKATGQQTICRGTHQDIETPVDTGLVCGNGPTAFDIIDQGIVDQTATRYYDADGNLTRRVRHDTWLASFWSNPATGDTVPYTQRDTITDVLAVPGDLGSATRTQVGENIYTDPVTHQKVLTSTGRVVFAPDGSLEFSAGQQPFIAHDVFGDSSVLDAVCRALAR